MKNLLTLAFALALPFSMVYAGIAGTYHVHGGNTNDGTSYTGKLVIEKEGEIFKSHWSLSDGSSTGTGVYKDGFLALNFVGLDAQNNPIVGVQLYKVHKDSLDGPWTINGVGTKGFEHAKKKNKHEDKSSSSSSEN